MNELLKGRSLLMGTKRQRHMYLLLIDTSQGLDVIDGHNTSLPDKFYHKVVIFSSKGVP